MALCGSFRCGCGMLVGPGLLLSGSGEAGDPFNLRIGSFGVDVEEITADHTLEDDDQLLVVDSGSLVTITVPDEATVPFAVGSKVDVFRKGAGGVTFDTAGGVTLLSRNGEVDIAGQYSAATVVKIGSDEWLLVGDLA